MADKVAVSLECDLLEQIVKDMEALRRDLERVPAHQRADMLEAGILRLRDKYTEMVGAIFETRH